MDKLVSIRMRASREISPKKLKGKEKQSDLHISGAEGIYKPDDIHKIVKGYIERALSHSKGKPDKIVITIEKIKIKPLYIKSLPVATLKIDTVSEARSIVSKLLISFGVSLKAINSAFKVLYQGNMRGAAIISSTSGRRFDNDKVRGIRVSRIGITKEAKKKLSRKLNKFSINNETVKEAIILASKVASSKDIIAELCISDDPDYTTGYVSSSTYGYLRIPRIKRKNVKSGGRVFFVKEGTNIQKITDYLERAPVIINKISYCRGKIELNEIIRNSNK